MEDTYDIDGFRIKILNDEDPQNPLLDFDTEPPVLVFSDRRIEGYAYGKEDGDAITPSEITTAIPEDKCREILLEITESQDEADEYLSEWGAPQYALAWFIQDNFATPEYWSGADKYFDLLETLAKSAGWPCFNGLRRGYVQGSEVRIFVLLTPAWAEVVGLDLTDPHAAPQAENAADLYAAWAFGDCYGYEIYAITADEDGDDTTGEGESLESLWGYYGREHEESGLLSQARESVQCLVAERDQKRLADEEKAKIEARESFDAACRDIVTVGA